ncbi:MAG: DUF1957 domain-containing protein [Treponema sp.]|nr:DUF1957 domain-containing protein [Treponema sp.]
MDARYAISIVLNVHLPFVKKFTAPPRRLAQAPEEVLPGGNAIDRCAKDAEASRNDHDLIPETAEESWFFEALSETYLPLLEVFERLEGDHVPFRAGLSISPIFAQMLSDETLLKKYAAYLGNQIEFGQREMDRVRDQGEAYLLAKRYFDQAVERQAAFTIRYEGNIIKAFDFFRRRMKVEFLATSATHAFLPFLCAYPEAVQAQLEVAIASYRHLLGFIPQGFWLPEHGWAKELEPFLRSYDFDYTITDSHGFVFGNPPPSRGSFFPVKTPRGLIVFARDFNASSDIAMMQKEGPYRDNFRDIGYELPVDALGRFLSLNGARLGTGFKYWKAGGEDRNALYDPGAAQAAAEEHARAFLENCCTRLSGAAQYMQEIPLSLCAFNADSFGLHWHEGPRFLEALFRLGAGYRELQFITPSEHLCHHAISSYETSVPEFSSWGENGYAETWLDSSNDWIYRHLNRSIERMVELAERFSENNSLKERALNQAAREMLLAQGSDWPACLYRQKCTDYARFQIENSLHNFTAIYEALGSGHISAEWLTSLERQHNIFPHINYRVFRRKR